MYEGVDNIERMIGGIANQQKVIANNVANAHTPGYAKQTYNFSDVLGRLSNPFETQLSQRMGSMKDSSFVEAEDGRPVNLSEEMVDLQKVFLNYSLVTKRVSTIFNNIRRATQIGR